MPKLVNENEEDQIKYLIGVSQSNLIEPWRIMLNREIKQESKKNEDIRVIFTDATNNNEKQVSDIEELVDQGIDLLIISPNDTEDLTFAIKQVYQKIPVIVVARDIQGEDYTLFIGPNNKEIGKKAGQYVVDMLGDQGGNIIEIQGASNSPPVRERSEGFKEEISNNDNINIVDTLVADWLRDKAEDKLKEVIMRHDKIDVIFAHNDAMAYGAYIAAKKYRINGIRFIGIDGLAGEKGGIELVKDGILECTFTSPTGGKEAIQYAIKILNNEKEIPKKIELKSEIITKSFIEINESNR
jgi:ABC-type sugar transport system substrate-binding protein